MSIVANENGLVENRILDSTNNYDESTLKQVSNYLNSKYSGKTIDEIKKALERDNFMTPSEAKDFGLIDEVVVKRT